MYGLDQLTPGAFIALIIGVIILYIVFRLIFPKVKK
jgi:hypothetical protein